MPLTRAGMYRVMDNVYAEICKLRDDTNGAYAPNAMRPFENFEEGSKDFEISREEDLWWKMSKHIIAIKMWVRATPENRIMLEQRETIDKRINDAILYLLVLRAMIEEEKLDGISVDSTDDAIREGLMVLGPTPLTIVKDDADSKG